MSSDVGRIQTGSPNEHRGSGGSSKLKIDPKTKVQTGRWKVELDRAPEPEMSPEELQSNMHENFEIEPSSGSIEQARQVAALSGGVPLTDHSVDRLRGERSKGSKTLMGLGGEDKAQKAQAGWSIAGSMVRSIAAQVRGGVFPTSDKLEPRRRGTVSVRLAASRRILNEILVPTR